MAKRRPKRGKRRPQERQDELLDASCNAILKTLAMRCNAMPKQDQKGPKNQKPYTQQVCMYACPAALSLQFLRVFACAKQIICVMIFWCTPAGKMTPKMAKMRPKRAKRRPKTAKRRPKSAKRRPKKG